MNPISCDPTNACCPRKVSVSGCSPAQTKSVAQEERKALPRDAYHNTVDIFSLLKGGKLIGKSVSGLVLGASGCANTSSLQLVDGGQVMNGGGPDQYGNNDAGDSKDNNGKPTIQLIDPAGRTTGHFNVRIGLETPYRTIVKDPDNDNIECRFEIYRGDGSYLDSRDWGRCDDFRYTISDKVDGFNVAARVRDSKGLEGDSARATIDSMANIPPVVVLKCPSMEFDQNDGLCIYRLMVDKDYCWDASDSYDDVKIVKYALTPDKNGGSTTSGMNASRCAGYTEIGSYLGSYSVTDNEGVTSTIGFHSIVSN